jgi:hypothetical protein
MPKHRRFPHVASGAFRRRRNTQNLRMRLLAPTTARSPVGWGLGATAARDRCHAGTNVTLLIRVRLLTFCPIGGLPSSRALHLSHARVVLPQPPVPCGGRPSRFLLRRRFLRPALTVTLAVLAREPVNGGNSASNRGFRPPSRRLRMRLKGSEKGVNLPGRPILHAACALGRGACHSGRFPGSPARTSGFRTRCVPQWPIFRPSRAEVCPSPAQIGTRT